MKYYRCGWCGNPTNQDGDCLSVKEIPYGTEEDWNGAINTNGSCCPNGDEDTMCRSIEPTEDMLRDAGLL